MKISLSMLMIKWCFRFWYVIVIMSICDKLRFNFSIHIDIIAFINIHVFSKSTTLARIHFCISSFEAKSNKILMSTICQSRNCWEIVMFEILYIILSSFHDIWNKRQIRFTLFRWYNVELNNNCARTNFFTNCSFEKSYFIWLIAIFFVFLTIYMCDFSSHKLFKNVT